ncbi:hypothetical protein BDV96DRAFT_587819 [Lophiotrema nucula]|uniref:UBC core domain-containing protein n=1 Tax=Lophiotrema nucula TaxID=690887 RepID=A0A6A5YMB8_9PLEO|nr:hypothetical protein BDV96DRAFT_587819 [Lophiotrema nucula]
MTPPLARRLLADIREMSEEPYPNIYVHVNNLEEFCLVLTPEDYDEPLHLTITIPLS